MDLARKIALDVLIAFDRDESYPNLLLKEILDKLTDRRDRSFCTNIVYGTIENKLKLDYFISKVSSVPLKKIHVVTRNILRMGLYQGLYMDVPVSAACNTSVELAKKNRQFKSSGFVNAVLRKLLSDTEICRLPTGDDAQSLSVRYSVDSSIITLLKDACGIEFVKEYFDALETVDFTVSHIAVNTLKIDSKGLADKLLAEDVQVLEIEEGLLRVKFTSNPAKLESFKSGLFHIIGKPSYITASKLNVCPGDFVLDLCSAPGGKTFALAYKMKNRGKIVAYDIHQHKIDEMKKQAKRLGITNIEFICGDSSVLRKENLSKADKVLCDVPCSGLGIIGKKPDIRYKNLTDFSLKDTQKSILANGYSYLKNGGQLVYSTCTINPKENTEIVSSQNVKTIEEMTFLPQTHQTEGFYYAVITKE